MKGEEISSPPISGVVKEYTFTIRALTLPRYPSQTETGKLPSPVGSRGDECGDTHLPLHLDPREKTGRATTALPGGGGGCGATPSRSMISAMPRREGSPLEQQERGRCGGLVGKKCFEAHPRTPQYMHRDGPPWSFSR